jgi:hypothetical protein
VFSGFVTRRAVDAKRLWGRKPRATTGERRHLPRQERISTVLVDEAPEVVFVLNADQLLIPAVDVDRLVRGRRPGSQFLTLLSADLLDVVGI